MKMKDFKEKILKEKDQLNVSIYKTQESIPSKSSPDLTQRFKSKTLLNKENWQPNLPPSNSKSLVKNSFGAAKISMRQSADDLKFYLSQQTEKNLPENQSSHFKIPTRTKYAFMSKSASFNLYDNRKKQSAFIKKPSMKNLNGQQNDYELPIAQDCEIINSQQESSENLNQQQKLSYAKSYCRLNQQQKLSYAKSYCRPSVRQRQAKPILIHESLNYDQEKPRQILTFGPKEANNIKRYKFEREEQKKMKNQIVNDIIMHSRAEIMRSCNFQNLKFLCCVNHNKKRAKYRLNAVLTEEEEEYFYCSKCAVNLAKQGFDIQQISALDQRMILSRRTQNDLLRVSTQTKDQQAKRQEEFTNFKKKLNALKIKIINKLNLFTQKSEQMAKIDKKIELTIENYNRLIQILKDMKNEEIQKEQQSRKQKSLNINLKKHELTIILENIKNTSFEMSNEKNKLISLDSNEFSFIFDSYANKIHSYEEYLTNLEKTQLGIDIADFDENIDSEGFDEDTIIQLIFDEMYKRLTDSKLIAIADSQKSYQAQPTWKPSNQPQIESTGSSMFYCCEDQVSEETRPPFRILFENCKVDDTRLPPQKIQKVSQSQNLRQNLASSETLTEVNRSFKRFKEEGNFPTNLYQK